MEMFSLKNKIAVVTGALGLLGRRHCKALAEAGATVIVCDLSESDCVQFANQLGNDAFGASLDVTDPESIRCLRDRLANAFHSIDILINNAAVNDMFENPSTALELSMFENYPLEQWRRSLDVNVTGVFLCSQILGSLMAQNGKGSIINIASTYGIVAPDQSLYRDETGNQTFFKSAAYPTTKGAVLSFTRFLAAYWGDRGVRVNALSPGGTQNGQKDFFIKKYSDKTPLRRMADPSDYEGAIIFLASDASAYMTGANLVVDGGWTVW